MRGGTDLQTYVDILVPSNAKLTLIQVCFPFQGTNIQCLFLQQGEGPIHLIGSHCIDFFAGVDEEADTEDEDDEMEVGGVSHPRLCLAPFLVLALRCCISNAARRKQH